MGFIALKEMSTEDLLKILRELDLSEIRLKQRKIKSLWPERERRSINLILEDRRRRKNEQL